MVNECGATTARMEIDPDGTVTYTLPY